MDSEMTVCPECGSNVRNTDEKCGTCGYPLKRKSEIINHIDPQKRIIGIALVAAGIVLVFLSYKTRFMGEYDYYDSVIDRYEESIRDYRDSKQEMLDEAYSYNSGFFSDSYKDIADSYQDLIDDAKDSIDECKGQQRMIVVKAVIMLIVAVGMAGAGGYLIKKNSGENV